MHSSFGFCFFCTQQTKKILISTRRVKSEINNRQKIRKIQTLIIGDTCTTDITNKYKSGNTIEVLFPDRSFEASYQIFLHIESLLEENGRLVILNGGKHTKPGFTIFDYPFLHPITIKEMNREGWDKHANLPILVEPILCLKYLIHHKKRHWHEACCPLNELKQFCEERNIELIYLETD